MGLVAPVPPVIEGTPGAGNAPGAVPRAPSPSPAPRIKADICIMVRSVSGFDLFDGKTDKFARHNQ